MKKSELKKIIKEELQKVIKEGTWAIPKTPEEVNKAITLVKEFKKFKQKAYKILGDDELFDYLDKADYKMHELIQTAHNNFGIKK